MGQYHITVNLDKREYIHPHRIGDGLKLWEQAASGPGGVATALIPLLAVSNGEAGRGGGDFTGGKTLERDENGEFKYVTTDKVLADVTKKVVGRWGGDRIAIIGDYAESDDLAHEDASHLYTLCGTDEDAREHIEWLRERGDDEQADAFERELETGGTFTDITELVTTFLSLEIGFKYEGDGWTRRTSPFEQGSTAVRPDMIVETYHHP